MTTATRQCPTDRSEAPIACRGGFTLVELLVVVGIIGILIGILMPALSNARIQSQWIACQSNLNQIHLCTRMYANDNRDHFPDAYSVGNYEYRMAPGLRTADDAHAKPEVYGLAAMLHGIQWTDDLSGGVNTRCRYLDARSKVWICPAAGDNLQALENTYAFNIGALVGGYTSLQRGRKAAASTLFVWDNYSSRAGLSGFRGPFAGYTIPTSQRVYPHRKDGKRFHAINAMFLDGHIDLKQLP